MDSKHKKTFKITFLTLVCKKSHFQRFLSKISKIGVLVPFQTNFSCKIGLKYGQNDTFFRKAIKSGMGVEPINQACETSIGTPGTHNRCLY